MSLPPLFTLEILREIIEHRAERKPSHDMIEKHGLTKCLVAVQSVTLYRNELVFKGTELLVAKIAKMAKQNLELLKTDYPSLTESMIFVALRTDETA